MHYMTADEIRTRYKWLKPGRESVRILAELNNCDMDEIKEIIGKEIIGGENIGGENMGKLDCDKARMLYEQGASDGQIGKECGCSGVTVLAWRRKEGLAAIGKPGGRKPSYSAAECAAAKVAEPVRQATNILAEVAEKLTVEDLQRAAIVETKHDEPVNKMPQIITAEYIRQMIAFMSDAEKAKLADMHPVYLPIYTAEDVLAIINNLNTAEHMKVLDYYRQFFQVNKPAEPTLTAELESTASDRYLEGQLDGMKYVIDRMGARV